MVKSRECDGLLGTDEICEYCGITKKSLYKKWLPLGLPAHRAGAKGLVSSKRAIDDFFYELAKKGAK